jgi:hypothetical protein
MKKRNYFLFYCLSVFGFTSLILSAGSQLCSNKVEQTAHKADPLPFVNGRFISHFPLFISKSIASLLPEAIARLSGE